MSVLILKIDEVPIHNHTKKYDNKTKNLVNFFLELGWDSKPPILRDNFFYFCAVPKEYRKQNHIIPKRL